MGVLIGGTTNLPAGPRRNPAATAAGKVGGFMTSSYGILIIIIAALGLLSLGFRGGFRVKRPPSS
ncbi:MULTISPECIES: hypothetical protein [unclassified Frankia]|uniref:hypothetical protein n=1 Tax=unclassified Frankia TaxID=2632575 RepID=UPI002AD29A3B|nr:MULTISPECIES: hypothetical protein [unclassified Frankia]